MGSQADVMDYIADQVRQALEAADLGSYADLLDDGVRWGPPGDPVPPCRSREQVLAWYRRGREAGTRARVTETLVVGDKILVGLKVSGPADAVSQAGEADRWQVLTVRGGRVAEIVGFGARNDAAAWAGLEPPRPAAPGSIRWSAPAHRLADDRIGLRLPELTPACCMGTPRGPAGWTAAGRPCLQTRPWPIARRWSATGSPGGGTRAASTARP